MLKRHREQMSPKVSPTPDDEARRQAYVQASEALITGIAQRVVADDDELYREFLDLPQVAAILKVGETRIREMVRTGELGSLRPGKRILVPRAELLRYRDEQLRRGRAV